MSFASTWASIVDACEPIMPLLLFLKPIVLGTTFGSFNLATISAVIGSVILARLVYQWFTLSKDIFFRKATDYTKYGAGKGAWAVVTGASTGIGREFAFQMAEKGFNVYLMARTEEKLNEVSGAIKDAYGVETVVRPFDFADADSEDWEQVGEELAKLEVGVLVNNVGINQEFPGPFAEEDPELLASIVDVNCKAQVRMARLIFPQMIERHKGLILNIGSVAGLIPSAFLATYSGSKAFLRTWSRAMSLEAEAMGVQVQHVKAYYVSTRMSKMRPSRQAPTAQKFVQSVIRTGGQYEDSAPYPWHMVFVWAIENLLPETPLMMKTGEMHLQIRKIALKKRADRAAAEKKK